MSDLIRREDLIKKIFPYGMPDGGNYGINARAVMEAVMGVAAVDAEPVVYADLDDWLELRTCYCPLCDKHFKVRSNDSSGDCPDCGHHVVLREVEE